MTYGSYHIPIHSPQEGYNMIAKHYKNYHAHLDSFEKGVFQKFIPRNMKHARIIDIGAGDGRSYKYFKDMPYDTYTACDIAQDLLKQHPGKIEKVVCDINQGLPFADNSYTLATSFFVIEYVQDIDNFCQEVYRILEDKGRRILSYFIQKRQFTHTINDKEFKIEQYYPAIDTIEQHIQDAGFTVYREQVYEKNNLLGYIRVADK